MNQFSSFLHRLWPKFDPLGNSSWFNHVKLYNNGTEAFDAMWGAIDSASHYVFLESYILSPDAVGLKTISKLTNAAKRGCDVVLLYDSIGSSEYSISQQLEDAFEPLITSGGHVLSFNKVFPWNSFHLPRYSPFFRNHRKTLVIDDSIAFAGGINQNKDWLNNIFRDTHVAIRGQAVLSLKKVFLSSVAETSELDAALDAAAQAAGIEPTSTKKTFRNKLGNISKSIKGFSARRRKFLKSQANDFNKWLKQQKQDTSSHLSQLPADPSYLLPESFLPFFKEAPKDDESPATLASSPQSTTNQKPIEQVELKHLVPTWTVGCHDKWNSIAPTQVIEQPKRNLRNNIAKTDTYVKPFLDWTLVQVLSSSSRRSVHNIQKSLHVAIDNSHKSVHLTSPYFVPYRKLEKSITSAARHGIDVKILTTRETDVVGIKYASEYVYGDYLLNGVEIFQLDNQFLHAKTAVIDNIYSTVGTFNLDSFSHRNLEVSLTFFDLEIAQQLERDFQRDLKNSIPLTFEQWQSRPLWSKFMSFVCYWTYQLLIRF